MFGPSDFWTMAPLRYAAKFDPFLFLDCASMPSTLAQSKERKGSNFAIWQPCFKVDPSPATRAALAYCGADKIVEVRKGDEPVLPLDPAARLLSVKLPIQEYIIPACADGVVKTEGHQPFV